VTPATALAEERGRRTLAFCVEHYGLLRGNWEVDYPGVVEGVLAMASGRSPSAVASPLWPATPPTPSSSSLIARRRPDSCSRAGATTTTTRSAPSRWADLHEGAIQEVWVTVSRDPSPPKRIDEEVRP